MIYRSNGEPTYFAADIGYVTEKFSRGFDHLIYIWGADHHGTVARLRNAAEAMGYDREPVQMRSPHVHGSASWRDGGRRSIVGEMTKRAGEGSSRSTTCWRRSASTRALVLRVTSATTGHRLRHRAPRTKQSSEEPGLLRPVRARADRVDLAQGSRRRAEPATTVAGTLGDGPEGALARAIVRLPEVVEDAVGEEETQGITAYATELATAFHAFYRDARVVDPAEPERSASRLAPRARGSGHPGEALGLLGISAPEAM